MAWRQRSRVPNPCHRETRLIAGDYCGCLPPAPTNWCCRSTFCASQLGRFDPFADCKGEIGPGRCGAPLAEKLSPGCHPEPCLAFLRVLYLRKAAREIVFVPLQTANPRLTL